MLFIKNMLLYAIEKNGINHNKLLEYCNIYSSDRRYKPFMLASTCSWSYNESGIIQYKGIKYYYNFSDKDNVIVER